MNTEAIVAYVRDERARGVSDDALRGELAQKGWSASIIAEVMGVGAVPGVSEKATVFNQNSLAATPAWVASRSLAIGFSLFIISSALLFQQGAGSSFNNRTVFAAFSLTHGVNIVAAFFLFLAAWRLSHSLGYRIWVALLSVVVVLFAVTSLAHFISLATGANFFDALQRELLGDDYLPLIIYFVLLPLQAVVFLLLLITLWVLGFLRKRRGSPISLRVIDWTVFVFLIMALLALFDVYLALEHQSFGF